MGVVWILILPGNLFKITGVLTWAWLFLTSDLMEAARGQKHPSEAKKGMKDLIS